MTGPQGTVVMAHITHKFASYMLLLMVVCAVRVAMCARILAVFPNSYFSHQLVYRAAMTELARRGHHVVVITTDPMNDPSLANYTEVDVSFLYEDHRKHFRFMSERKEITSQEMSNYILTYGLRNADLLLSYEPIKKLISPQSKEHFDLVFIEWLSSPTMYVFAHRFSAPMIGIISASPYPMGYDSVANPTNPSYIPNVFFPHSDKMTFFERLDSLVFAIRQRHFYYNTLMPRHQAVARRHLGPSAPNILEMHFNVSMLFVTHDHCFHHPRPAVPAVVYVSGLQLKPPKRLPQDIQNFMDSAPKGVIYFSLGSTVRSNRLDARTRQAFVDAFRELGGYHVLWKFESDNLTGQPDNVKIRKWMPQQDVLKHPKVKVFIMQGGLQSTEEAIHSGIPLICIPFFADQGYNARRITEKGVGLRLVPSELSKAKILWALRTVLTDQRYYDNMQRLSFQMRDQPSSGLERAVWWTEYVLRHKGAAHLRTAAVDMPLYKYLLLDVVAFLVAIALLAILLLWMIAKFVHRRLRALHTWKVKKI